MNDAELQRAATALERIGLVLGALYASGMGEVDQGVKVERLSCCGFSNTEIASILGTTPNTVNVALHRVRKAKRSSRSKK